MNLELLVECWPFALTPNLHRGGVWFLGPWWVLSIIICPPVKFYRTGGALYTWNIVLQPPTLCSILVRMSVCRGLCLTVNHSPHNIYSVHACARCKWSDVKQLIKRSSSHLRAVHASVIKLVAALGTTSFFFLRTSGIPRTAAATYHVYCIHRRVLHHVCDVTPCTSNYQGT